MPELIVKLKERELSRVPILRATTRIGRDETNDLVIDNIGVSRHHASVLYNRGGFEVVDEGSANGIFVNGERIERTALANGDVIAVGKFAVVFSEGGGVAASQLMRDSPLVPSDDDPKPQAYNPLQTTALSADDLKRMLEKMGRGEIAATIGNNEETLRQKIVPPTKTAAPAPAAKPRRKSPQDKQTQLLKWAVGGLSVVVLLLIGGMVYLLLR